MLRRVDAGGGVSDSKRLRIVDLTDEQRLLLAKDARNPRLLIEAEDSAHVTIDLLVKAGCVPEAITQSGILPTLVASHSLHELQVAGFDATHLTSEPGFCECAIRTYGADAVREAFVITSSDAIAVAGPPAEKLGMMLCDLLLHCAQLPDAARAVIQLHGVDDSIGYESLRITNIRAQALASVGLSSLELMQRFSLTAPQLVSLGFNLKL